ncbi:MAG: hypothetical protein KIS96_05630 [Bauldia sp.]|nr:hypothetical protein [Bauldia sp.]
MPSRRDFLLLSAAAGLTFAVRPSFAAETRLAFNDLYEREAQLSALTEALTGQPVVMTGFMAPPLKAEASFFVLTKTPLAVCPFCETEAQWPDDIVLVLTRGIITAVPFNVPIVARGVLDTGFEIDPETGFVSLIRIEDATFARA